MSSKKAKQLANHCWNKTEEEIEAAIEKAVRKEKIKDGEIEKVRRRIEERKKEYEEVRKIRKEAMARLRQKEIKTEEKAEKQDVKTKKAEKKNTPQRKKLQSAAMTAGPKIEKKLEPLEKERIGRILSLHKATQRDPLGWPKIINKGRHSVTIREFLLFPEDIGIEINTMSAIFTEKKDCFVANLGGVLIKNIPKELRYEDTLKGIFSLIVIKKVEGKWTDLYLNLIYRQELNGSRPVYAARIDSEKESPLEGSMHTTPTTNTRMILHLYPM